METTNPVESWPLPASDADKRDVAGAAPYDPNTQASITDENQVEEPAEDQAKETKKVVKGKGRHNKKHGVMSLPAEIRETYALPSALNLFSLRSKVLTQLLDRQHTLPYRPRDFRFPRPCRPCLALCIRNPASVRPSPLTMPFLFALT